MEIKVAQNAIFSKIRKFDNPQINLVEVFFKYWKISKEVL